MLIVNSRIQVPLREFRFTFSRSPGPGGQNVNKVNSKATLHWNVTGTTSIPEAVRERFLNLHRARINQEGEVFLSSSRFRDQGRNTADCLEKLRSMLAEAAVAPTLRKKTKPSAGAKRRRLDEKRRRSDRKSMRRTLSDE
ncbi:MAG: alternative ribosome rescue aminoacyl-tRNA hydrolase ArfB [Thermoguttaceae bacterium]